MAPRKKKGPPADSEAPHAAGVPACADALLRCAVESCRQHQRVGRLVHEGATDLELEVARRTALLCDGLLKMVSDAYAPAAAQKSSATEDEQARHRANDLWRASRAFTNRFLDSGHLPDSGRDHSSEQFLELRLQAELDASALLNLRQAADAYSAARAAAKL